MTLSVNARCEGGGWAAPQFGDGEGYLHHYCFPWTPLIQDGPDKSRPFRIPQTRAGPRPSVLRPGPQVPIWGGLEAPVLPAPTLASKKF